MPRGLEQPQNSCAEAKPLGKELGGTGVALPEIGLGTYLYRGTAELLRKGIALGAAFIDTAELYGNEDVVGAAVKGIRDRVFIATKTHHWKYAEVLESAEASLRRLGIDTIDLYQLHWANAAVPIQETMGAMEELVEQGKVRFIGVSNFTVKEFVQAQSALRKNKIVSNQMRYSVVDRNVEVELLPFCRARGVTLIAYSPLGHNFQTLLAADRCGLFAQLSKVTGKTPAQIALNWCVAKPGVVAIPKTECPTHLAENCASSDWRLSEAQIAALDRGFRFARRSRLVVAMRRFVRRSLQKIRGR
jgi:diketogulonate reductase-like aldo/keto reductase